MSQRETYPRKSSRSREGNGKLRCEIASILREGETGQKSPRAFKGLNETGAFKEEGFYEREILQQTVCTHLTDQYTSEDVARTKLPCYIPRPPPRPATRNFRGDNAVKIGSYFIVGIIIKKKEEKERGRRLKIYLWLLSA